MPRERKPSEVSIIEGGGIPYKISGGPVSRAAALIRKAAELRRRGVRADVEYLQDLRYRDDKNEWEAECDYLVHGRSGMGSIAFYHEREAKGFAFGLKLCGATRVRIEPIQMMESAPSLLCWRVHFRLPQLGGK
jgi:hypothetical protein